MVLGLAKDKPMGQIIMVGLHQKLDTTNAKNLVGYFMKSNHKPCTPKSVFLLIHHGRSVLK